jgi:hypothetical protein
MATTFWSSSSWRWGLLLVPTGFRSSGMPLRNRLYSYSSDLTLTALSYRSTLGQPSFYRSMNLAPPGEPGYGHTANMYSLMNGSTSTRIPSILVTSLSIRSHRSKLPLLCFGCSIQFLDCRQIFPQIQYSVRFRHIHNRRRTQRRFGEFWHVCGRKMHHRMGHWYAH